MKWHDVFNGFQFEHNGGLNDNVCDVAAVQRHAVVTNWQTDLSIERYRGAPQLMTQACLID